MKSQNVWGGSTDREKAKKSINKRKKPGVTENRPKEEAFNGKTEKPLRGKTNDHHRKRKVPANKVKRRQETRVGRGWETTQS